MNKIIPVRYKGANYMCVEGSDRARFLTQANDLWLVGDASYRDLFALALGSPGCAFTSRRGADFETVSADIAYAMESLGGACNG